jgi:hypothetical protein
MRDQVERLWAVRDIALQWLYVTSASGRVRSFDAAKIVNMPGWQGGELSQEEVDQATDWLLTNGHISGTGTWGGTVIAPRITALGERYADVRRSVRGPLEDPVSVSNAFTFNNSGTGNFAVNSPGAQQSNTVTTNEIEKAAAVADALEKAASESEVTEKAAAEARDLAVQIRAATNEPEMNRFSLRRLMLLAGGSLVTTFGNAAAEQVGPLALEAAHALMS